MQNYHDTHKVFCAATTGTYAPWDAANHPYVTYSYMTGWVGLLPYFEQRGLWDQFSAPYVTPSQTFNPFGPYALHGTARGYPPAQNQVSLLLCPSDGAAHSKGNTTQGYTNYHFSFGDKITGNFTDQTPRSPFGRIKHYGFRDITDGSSNTLAVSEGLVGAVDNRARRVKGGTAAAVLDLPTNPMGCYNRVDPNDPKRLTGTVWGYRGRYWTEGHGHVQGITTILPPNGPSCACGEATSCYWGVFSPNSNHPGGVNGLRCDASVNFITETINTGNLSATEPEKSGAVESPYGVWGALGSRAGGEAYSQ